MARMIPLHIPPTTESAAERTLFDELERSCSESGRRVRVRAAR